MIALAVAVTLAGFSAGRTHAQTRQPPPSPQPTATARATPTPPPTVTPPPGPAVMPLGRAAGAEFYLPVLSFLGTDEACATVLLVQNVGSEPAKATLITWGAPSQCPPLCGGPHKVECSGLLRPGASWTFTGAQIPARARNGAIFSFTARTLREIGVELGFDDIVADLMCETLFFGVVGNCDDYRSFKQAFDQGLPFAGVPQDRARGAPLAVEVARRCDLGGGSSGIGASATYNAVTGADLGDYDAANGGFGYDLPSLYRSPSSFSSTVSVQNAGSECMQVELWFREQDSCAAVAPCAVLALPAGESRTIDVAGCAGAGKAGSGWLRTSQPAAVAVDTVIADTLMTYTGQPQRLDEPPDPADPAPPSPPSAGVVAWAPLVYSEFEPHWTTRIHIQNTSATTEAQAKLYVYGRSGDIVTTSVRRICPRGTYTFDLPDLPDLPGNWVGSARVESQQWWDPHDPAVQWPGIVGVVELLRRRTDTGPVSEAIAYEMLTEADGFKWQLGAGRGGTDSGIGLIAIPNLMKAVDAAGVTSEFAVANLVPKPGFTDFAIFIYDQNGLLDFVCGKLNEKQVEYINLKTWGYISPAFKGSAIVSAIYWRHEVYDNQGRFVRNLLGLGAVSVSRPGYVPSGAGTPAPAIDGDGPGDVSTGSRGIPLRADDGAEFFRAAALGFEICPGMRVPTPRTPTPWPPWRSGTATVTPALTVTITATAVKPTVTTAPRLPFRVLLPVALFTLALDATPGPSPEPSSTPTTSYDFPSEPYLGPSPRVHLPVLNFVGADDLCTSQIAVQNVGREPSKAILITWGEPGFCPPQCGGPLKVECSGLIKPGASWRFLGADVPTGSRSGVVFSFTAKLLSEIGVDLGFDDVVADLMCESLFFEVVGDCDDYRRFLRAYDSGDTFAGVPQDKARGAPLVADVARQCPSTLSPGPIFSAAYRGVPATSLGAYDPILGGYTYYVPLIYAAKAGFSSVVYVHNAGPECISVETWFKAQEDCLLARMADLFTLAPGETYSVDMLASQFYDWQGSAWLRSTGPLAIVADVTGRDVLLSFNGVPESAIDLADGSRRTAGSQLPGRSGSQVLYGPLVYSEYQGWDSGVQVQNLSPVTAAKVKAYFLDRSGDVITTLSDWICPRGSQTFFLPMASDLPGNWVGSVRVESQEWWIPGDEGIAPPSIAALATLIKYTGPDRGETLAAAAYDLLGEASGYDWKYGHGGGGLESGVGLVALPLQARGAPDGVRTELAVMNLVPVPGYTDYAVILYDQNGHFDSLCQRLWEKQVEYIDLAQWGHVTPEFVGSALISAGSWHHPYFDAANVFQRNLVGLAAVLVQRSGTELGTDVPGDELAVTVGAPLRGQLAADLAGTIAGVRCPDPVARPPELVAAPARPAERARVHLPVLNGQPTAGACRAVVTVQKRPSASDEGKVSEAVAYELLPEGQAFDWSSGRGAGGPASGSGVIAIPAARKAGGDTVRPADVTTEVAIANFAPQPGFTDFTVWLFDQNGLVDVICERLNERQVEYINLATWGFVAPEFQGSLLVSAVFWDHELVDAAGRPVRNLLGLGALVVQRSGTVLGVDVAGDEAAALIAFPVDAAAAADLVGPALRPGNPCPPPRPPATLLPAPAATAMPRPH